MIETDRLILRPWRASDVVPFHALSQNEEVMRYLGPRPRLTHARHVYHRMTALQMARGFCFWAVERKADARFLGYCGLNTGEPSVENEVEIGWRLARWAWGQGFAHEAAAASLAWGWRNLDVPGIAGFTVPDNARSWGLMERLGMTRCPDEDFDHPDLDADDPLRAHIIYRIARPVMARSRPLGQARAARRA